MKFRQVVAVCTLAGLCQPLPAFSQSKDQVVGTILGIILNEAVKGQGTAKSEAAPVERRADGPRVVEGPKQPKMNKADRMAVQRALAAAGFYDGAIDGSIGPASRSAIAAWQASMGAEGSGYLTREQAETLIAVAPPELAPLPEPTAPSVEVAEIDPRAIEADLAAGGLLIDVEKGTTPKAMRADLYREFLLRQVMAVPERLENEAFIAQALSRSAQLDAFGTPEVAEWNDIATRGTEFERQEAHAAFAILLSERMTGEPLSYVRVSRMSFPEYDFEKGRFPLELANIFRLTDRTYFGSADGTSIQGDPGAWASVASVDVPLTEAEGIAERIHAMNGFADVVMRVTLSNFRQNAEGRAISDVRIDSVSVHLPGDLQAGNFGPLLIAVPDPALAPVVDGLADLGQARDALESWSRLGAPVADDRLVLNARNGDAMDLLEPAFSYLALAGSHDTTLSLAEIAQYATSFLTEAEQASLFGGNLDDTRFTLSLTTDEFAVAEIKDRFASTFGPALRQRAPVVPVAARLTVPVSLGEYDFVREAFPISLDPYADRYGQTEDDPKPFAIELSAQPEFRSLTTDVRLTTTEIPLGKAEAKALNARLKSEVDRLRMPYGPGYNVYLALDMVLEEVVVSPKDTDYGFGIDAKFRQSDTALQFKASVSKAVLYEDPALTRPILDLPLDRVATETQAVAYVEGSAMPVGDIGSQTGLLAYALREGVDPSILTDIADAAASQTGADEFTRPEIAEELVQMVKSAPAPDEKVYFHAEVTLGEYRDGAFPITDVAYLRQDLTSPSGYMLPGDTLNFLIANTNAFPNLPLERQAARDLVTKVPSRKLKALVEVALDSAKIVPSTKDDTQRQVQIGMTNVAMHLADPDDETRRLFVVPAKVPETKPEVAAKEAPQEVAEVAPPATATEVPAAAPAAAPADPAIASKARDVVGLRLGMSLEEARAAIDQHMKVARVLEWRSETVAPTIVGELARLYINDAGNEFIIVNFGPVAFEPRVTAIARNLFLPVGAVSDGDLATQLIQKYGEPEPGMGWYWSGALGLYGCAEGGQQMTLSWVGAPVVEGPPMAASAIDSARASTDPAYAADVLVLARSSNLMYGLGPNPGAAPQCTETVRSEILRNWSNQVTNPPIAGDVSDLFVTRLIDQTVLRRQMEEAMEAEKAKLPEVEIKL